jgi:hypothetical protein
LTRQNRAFLVAQILLRHAYFARIGRARQAGGGANMRSQAQLRKAAATLPAAPLKCPQRRL